MDELKGYDEDAQPPNDEDPEFQQEMFELFRARGYKPEDLIGAPEWVVPYAEWLKAHQDEEA